MIFSIKSFDKLWNSYYCLMHKNLVMLEITSQNYLETINRTAIKSKILKNCRG